MLLNKKLLPALIFAGMLSIPVKAHSAPGPQVVGTWLCSVVRAGTVLRPIIYTFHADGTFNYSSGTTVNNSSDPNSPIFDSGIHSRGEAWGIWEKTGPSQFSANTVEILRDANGNAWGVFNVANDFLLTPSGQLCSGVPTSNPAVWGSDVSCPNQMTSFSLEKMIFDQGVVDNKITDSETKLSGKANSVCNRVGSGAGFPGIPIPDLP